MTETFSTLYILKWTDENKNNHEERSWNLEKTLKRSHELKAKGYNVERYKLIKSIAIDTNVVQRPI